MEISNFSQQLNLYHCKTRKRLKNNQRMENNCGVDFFDHFNEVFVQKGAQVSFPDYNARKMCIFI